MPPLQWPTFAPPLTVLFVQATALITTLARAHAEGRLEDRLGFYAKPKLLIDDELGYLPFEPNAAHLFFQLVSRRYERGSLLVTSNRSVGEWGTVFGDPVVATAILDRLLHHSHVVTIRGDSYRCDANARRHRVSNNRSSSQCRTRSSSGCRLTLLRDIDQGLDAWQMGRQRAAVPPPRRRACRTPGRILGCRLVGGGGLLDLLQPQLQLILRQRLGTAPEAVALQFADDLLKPIASRALRQQHRLQRAGIVRKRVRHARHGED